MKKIMSMLVAICLLFSLSTVAFAADTSPASPVIFLGEDSEYSPIGELSEEECQELLNPNMSRHFNPIPHSHEITSITSQYRGRRNRGVVAETEERVPIYSDLTYSKAREISNSYSVSIGFEKSIVSGTLGYNVTYSTTDTAEYTLHLEPNQMGSITLYDKYDVTTFDVKTTYIINQIPLRYSYEYGTGWAEQWTNFSFSGNIW